MNEEEILKTSYVTILIPDSEYRYHEFPSFRFVNGKIKYRNPLDYLPLSDALTKEFKDYVPKNHFEYFYSAELWLRDNKKLDYYYKKIPKYTKGHPLIPNSKGIIDHVIIANLYNDNGIVVIENINETYYLYMPSFTEENKENLYKVGLYFINTISNKLIIIYQNNELSIEDYLNKNFGRKH